MDDNAKSSPQDGAPVGARERMRTTLLNDGYDMPDSATFAKDMMDPGKRERMRTTLLNDGYDMPDSATFAKDMMDGTSSFQQPQRSTTTPPAAFFGGRGAIAGGLATPQDMPRGASSPPPQPSLPNAPQATAPDAGGQRSKSAPPKAPGMLLFERRWLDNKAPSLQNEDGTRSTHKMAWAEVDGKYIAYPTIVQATKGLQPLSDDAAVDYALKTGEYRQFDTANEAAAYADGGYKEQVPRERKERLRKAAPDIVPGYYAALDEKDKAMEEWRALRDLQRSGATSSGGENLNALMSAALQRADRADNSMKVFEEDENAIRADELDRTANENFDRLTKETDVPGVRVSDPYKIENAVRALMEKNGSSSNAYHDRLVHELTAKVDSKQVVDDMLERARKKTEPILAEAGKKFREGFVADKKIRAQAQAQMEAQNTMAKSMAAEREQQLVGIAKEEGVALQQKYGQQATEIEAQYRDGAMSLDDANSAIAQLNTQYQQEAMVVQERLQRTFAEDAARFNRQFLNTQKAIIDNANDRIQKELDAYNRNAGETDPELEAKVNSAYEEAYKEAVAKREGLVGAAASLRFWNDAMANPGGAMLVRMGEGFVKNLGGTLRTMGGFDGQSALYRLGADMESAYLLPESHAKKFTDLLDVANFAQLTGELAGGMAPSLVAGGVVATATAGAGAAPVATLLASGIASYATEGLQNSMDVRDQVMRQTGDERKATEAAYKTFGAHLDTWYLGLLDGLPFVGKVLDRIPTKALRMGAGGVAETAMESVQEVTQDESMANIIAGREAWDTGIAGVSATDRILDADRLGEMAVTMAPLTLFGMGGQLREGGVKAMAADKVRQMATDGIIASSVNNARTQWVNGLIASKGEKYADAVVGALYNGGYIDVATAESIRQDAAKVQVARREAQRAGVPDARTSDYVALRTKHMDMLSRAEQEQEGPVKAVLIQKAKAQEAIITSMLTGEDADYVKVTLPSGGSVVMDMEEATAFMADPKKMMSLVLSQTADKNATFEGFGKKGMAIAEKYGQALERFSNDVQQAREWYTAPQRRAMMDRQRRERKYREFKAEAAAREEQAQQERDQRTEVYKEGQRSKQEVAAQENERRGVPEAVINDYVNSLTVGTADAIEDAMGQKKEPGVVLPVSVRIRQAREAMRELNRMYNALKEKYKNNPAAQGVLDAISTDLYRVQQHRKALKEQSTVPESTPQQEARQELETKAVDAISGGNGKETVGASSTQAEEGGSVTPEAPKNTTDEERQTKQAAAPENTGAAAGVPATAEPTAAEPVATDLTEDLPDDPKLLADAYYDDHGIWNSNANPEYAMISAMKGSVKESSYDEWGDPNDKGVQMAKTYFAKKGEKGWGLDQIAQELTDELGREVAPDELAELMRANQSGLPRTSPRMRQIAERYKALTGKRLTSATGARQLKAKGRAAVKEPEVKDFIDQHTDQEGNVNWQGVKDNIHALGFLGYTDEQIRNIEAEADRQLAADTGRGAVLEPVREPEAATGQSRDEDREVLARDLEIAQEQLASYERSFKKQAESLFDKDAVEKKSRGRVTRAQPSMFEADGDTRANSAEGMEKGAKTLRDRVALAEKALADYDAQAGARQKAAAQQTSIEKAPIPKKKDPDQQKPSDKKPVKTGKLRTDRVIAALREVAPNLTVSAPKTAEEYATELERIGLDGVSSSWGIYDPNTNSIFLNPESPDLKQTLMHEAAHPLITALARNNPELFAKFHEEVMEHPDAQKYRDHAAKYKDKSEVMQAAEALAEFLGDAGAGRIKFSKDPQSLWQKMVAWFRDVMAALGWDTMSVDLSDAQSVQQFAKGFEKAMRKGIKITGFTPVDADIAVQLQDDADRLVDGWYSRLDQAVAAKGSAMPASQWKTWLEARAKDGSFSMEEAKWTGLSDWLASKGNEKVTPQQVREFLKENRVKVEVVERGDTSNAARYSQLDGRVARGEELSDSEQDEYDRLSQLEPDAKFSQYQLPGGTNYREVLVTLPTKDDYDSIIKQLEDTDRFPRGSAEREALKAKADKAKDAFRSSHFDEPNILVHLRLNDRTGPNGEKILFVEELQSDFAQAGRKRGFSEKLTAAEQQELDAIRAKVRSAEMDPATPQERERANELIAKSKSEGIPSAPFVTSTDAWVELGLKQAIRMAVKGGYDKIAWTTGEQQNERYDLSNQVDAVGYDGNTLWVQEKGSDGFSIMRSDVPENKIADYIGKDAAAKLSESNKSSGDIRYIEGDDLKVGGSGMKGFYDRILPTVAKKVSKRLGGDGVVGDTHIGVVPEVQVWNTHTPVSPWAAYDQDGNEVARGNTADEARSAGVNAIRSNTAQQSIAITPKMRSVVGMGVPLMQKAHSSKTAKQVNAATGVSRKRRYQKVDEREAVRQRIRDMAKAARDAVSAMRDARKAFAEEVKSMMADLKGRITTKQAASITTAAAKVDPMRPRQVERFAMRAARLIERVEYAQDMADARKAQQAAKTISKRKMIAINHRDILREAAKVNPANIEDPGAYADLVGRYIKGITDLTTPIEEQVSFAELEKAVDAWLNEQEEAVRDEDAAVAMIEASDRGAAVENASAVLASDDPAAAMADVPEEERESTEDVLRSIAKDRSEQIRTLDAAELMTDDADVDRITSSLITGIQEVNDRTIDLMSGYQAAIYIRAANNVLVNQSAAGIGPAIAMGRALNALGGTTAQVRSLPAASVPGADGSIPKPTRNALQIAEAMGPRARRWFSPRVAQATTSVGDMFQFYLGWKNELGEIQRLIGVGEYVRGKQKWNNERKRINEEAAKFYRGLRSKYGAKADGAQSMAAEGLAAFVTQQMPGLSEQESFDARKKIVLEDIGRKAETRRDKKQAEIAQKVYDRIIAPATDRKQVLSNLKRDFPAAHESLAYLMGMFKPYNATVRVNLYATWNQSHWTNDPFYLPVLTTRAANATTTLDPSATPSFSHGQTLKPAQPGSMKARRQYRSLGKDRTISYNIRGGSVQRLSEQLYDAYTTPARMRIAEFFRAPDAKAVFRSDENHKFVKDRMGAWLDAQNAEAETLWHNQVMDALAENVRRIGSVLALGGFLQLPKQYSEALVSASTMLGPHRFARNIFIPNAAFALLDQYAIGSRHNAIKGGTKFRRRLEELDNDLLLALRSGTKERIAAAHQKVQDFWMASLSKGDVAAAYTTWLAAYEKRREEQGHKVTLWEDEANYQESDPEREEAALYAETMTDRLYVSSDPAKMAAVSSKAVGPNSGPANLFRAGAFAFNSFIAQATSRGAIDAADVLFGPRDRKALALLGAGSRLAGTATFAGVSLYLANGLVIPAIGGLMGAIADAIGDDDEEDKEAIVAFTSVMVGLHLLGLMDADLTRAALRAQTNKLRGPKDPDVEREKRYRRWYTRVITDYLGMGLFPMGDVAMVDGINYVQYLRLLEQQDPSVYTQSGEPMKFSSWQRQEQSWLVRPGQGWPAGEPGLYGVFGNAAKDASKQWDLLTGNLPGESKQETPEMKAKKEEVKGDNMLVKSLVGSYKPDMGAVQEKAWETRVESELKAAAGDDPKKYTRLFDRVVEGRKKARMSPEILAVYNLRSNEQRAIAILDLFDAAATEKEVDDINTKLTEAGLASKDLMRALAMEAKRRKEGGAK